MEVFGVITDTFISRVYKHTIQILDNKADGILHGNGLQNWVPLFPEFVEAIKNKLNRPQYGGLLFENVRIVGFLDCKVDETYTPGTGPLTDKELASRCRDYPEVYVLWLPETSQVEGSYNSVPKRDYCIHLWPHVSTGK
jgi:hypothetical protein